MASQFTTAATTAPASVLTYDQIINRDRPALSDSNLNTIFTRCRRYAKESSFLVPYLKLKQDFYNYGFEIRVGEGSTADNKALRSWLDQDIKTDAEYTDPSTKETVKVQQQMTVEEAICKLVSDIWQEWLMLENVVTLWFKSDSLPTTVQPEQCTFTDKFGLPVLKYEHGLTEAEIAMLPEEQQARFKEKVILLSYDEGEFFKVLKSGPTGGGFSTPRLYSIFTLMSEVAQKEEGFHAQSYNLLAAPRQHKCGHKIDSGNHAGKPLWFLVGPAGKKRADKILEVMKNRRGPFDMPTNFDHEIEFPWPELDRFDDTAWKGTDKRLTNWGGPIAQMLINQKVDGLEMLRAPATEERNTIARYARRIIVEAFKAPDGLNIQLTWSDLIFNSPAQAADLLKAAVQNALVSVKTAREQIGYNDAKESAQKVAEGEDENATLKYRPHWDSAHALAPQAGETAATLKAVGQDANKTNGRPTGAENQA